MSKPNMKTLGNIGNSCYMNAILYALRFTPTFMHNLHHLINDILPLHQQTVEVAKHHQEAIDVLNKLHDVFVNLASSGRSYGAKRQSNQLQKAIYVTNEEFVPQTQQDAHEFLLSILNCVRNVSEALKNRMASDDLLDMFGSINNQASSELSSEYFRKTFMGQRSSTTRCFRCETVLSNVEEIIDVFVALPTTGSEVEQNFIRNSCVTTERIDGKIRCSECIHLWESTLTIAFPALPRILIVHIGRFDSEANKVNTVAPILYELDCFCSQCDGLAENAKGRDHHYRLYAIIVHVGKRPTSGHYMAYVRSGSADLPEEEDDEHDCQFDGCCKFSPKQTERIDEMEGSWFICNDDIITEVSQRDFATKAEREAERKTPYILLYARNDVVAA